MRNEEALSSRIRPRTLSSRRERGKREKKKRRDFLRRPFALPRSSALDVPLLSAHWGRHWGPSSSCLKTLSLLSFSFVLSSGLCLSFSCLSLFLSFFFFFLAVGPESRCMMSVRTVSRDWQSPWGSASLLSLTQSMSPSITPSQQRREGFFLSRLRRCPYTCF